MLQLTMSIFQNEYRIEPQENIPITILVPRVFLSSQVRFVSNFDQYIFESISALMRFIVAANPASLPTFEQALFGPATIILQQDIDRKYRQIEFMMCFSILIYCI